MQIYITMIRYAKYKNRNSELPAFGVTILWTLSVVIQVIYVYPFYNLTMVSEIFLNLAEM